MIRRALRLHVSLAAVIFLSAGSFHYFLGWAYLGLSLLSQGWLMIYFYRHDPDILRRRLLIREQNREQKIVIVLLRLVIGSTLVLAGLDYRFQWSQIFVCPVPPWLTVLGLLVIVGGQWLFFQTLRANRFAASIIRVEPGQTIAAAGPYRFVRHPMYLAFSIQWLAAPFALGSFIALAAVVFVVPVFVGRLLHEEKILRRDLPGYGAYCRQTPKRLVPFVW